MPIALEADTTSAGRACVARLDQPGGILGRPLRFPREQDQRSHEPRAAAKDRTVKGSAILFAAEFGLGPAVARCAERVMTQSLHRSTSAISRLRWVNIRGEKGPWSGIAIATVAA